MFNMHARLGERRLFAQNEEKQKIDQFRKHVENDPTIDQLYEKLNLHNFDIIENENVLIIECNNEEMFSIYFCKFN